MRDSDRIDRSIAKIDAYRARRIGEMLITEAPEEIVSPERVLIDLEPLSGRELLDQYHRRHATYGTAPFDPKGNVLRFYPGGVTIWSGFPGAGKTSLIRQFICHTLHRGSSVFLASLEEDPSDVLVRLAGTAAGLPEPEAHHLQAFIDGYRERFRLWGVIGLASHTELLGTVSLLAKSGIRHAVIDSLMCLDVANDDFEGQRKFANLLAATARAARVHVHLVAHPRKAIKADQEPDINDVAGAREIGGVADNVLFVRRSVSSSDYGVAPVATPMCVSIRKQRHGTGAIVDIEGWFQRAMRQYSEEQFAMGPQWYLPGDARSADVTSRPGNQQGGERV